MEKIVGVGFHKTGTTSLGDALERLGYRRLGWKGGNALGFKSGKTDDLLKLTDEFDCFEDGPWYLLYREIHQRHPGTRFVLTLRQSMDRWFESLVMHCDRTPPAPADLRRYLYGVDHPREDRDAVISVHRKHIADVRDYAARHGVPLLEFCPETGDGWEELCGFLNRPIPDEPFPHSNRKPSRLRAELGALRRRIAPRRKS